TKTGNLAPARLPDANRVGGFPRYRRLRRISPMTVTSDDSMVALAGSGTLNVALSKKPDPPAPVPMPVYGPESSTSRATAVPAGATPVTVPGSHVLVALVEFAIGV